MLKTELVQITRQSKIAEDEFYPMIVAMYEHIWQRLLPPQIPTDGLTTRVANNVVTPADAPIPDCVTCGACCMAMLAVGVRPHETTGTENFWEITVKGEKDEILVDRFLRRDPETFYCAALEIVNNEKALCSIYNDRPKMCRDFEAGSDKCHALRRAFGYEPFLSLEEMPEALRRLESRPAKSAPSETIREVKFTETGTGELQVSAAMRDGAARIIHVFDPQRETWRQFEFDGLTLAQAAALIDSRKWVPEVR
ncbi:MAG TPA: YkgJ family cysteine cluster protein [Pyrinomonadaceae bacterium]|jgi:Fe-S-cluster containining protein